MESDINRQMIKLIREHFGNNIKIPHERFEDKLARKKKHIGRYTQFLNGEWKAKFLNRLAPLIIDCYLKYEKPKWKGGRR